DETLRRAATAISARDTRIAVLEQRVSELLSSRLYARQEVYAAPGGALRTDHEPPAAPHDLSQEGDSAAESHGLGDQHARPYADQDADEPQDAVAEPSAAVEPEDDATPPDAHPDADPGSHPGGADMRVEAHPDATAAFDASAAADEDRRESEPVRVAPGEDGDERK
ncbi:MAG TPA: hypothetical protein VM347_10230, partial [Nonomuraea sp.]|nr:hypothetical protein [Nonomuraea sp.]